MTGTFFDTIIICTMTGLVLVLTDAWNSDFSGAAMTTSAFKSGLSPVIGHYIVTIGLLFFAFTTILGWNYYGEKCVITSYSIHYTKLYEETGFTPKYTDKQMCRQPQM